MRGIVQPADEYESQEKICQNAFHFCGASSRTESRFAHPPSSAVFSQQSLSYPHLCTRPNRSISRARDVAGTDTLRRDSPRQAAAWTRPVLDMVFTLHVAPLNPARTAQRAIYRAPRWAKRYITLVDESARTRRARSNLSP